MLTFEREISELGGSERMLAIERREIFSIYPELRAMSWIGVMLIVAGVGLIVSKNLDRIGPVVLAAAIGMVALACYGFAIWRRKASLLDEFVLLLGALLLSADIGYIESQFHLLDHGWPRHFLILAAVHGVTAYFFESRTLLTLSIAALAAWLGVEARPETIMDMSTETSMRGFLCAAIVLAWRFVDARQRKDRSFERVFEHFAANLALLSALALGTDESTRVAGCLLTIVLAVFVIRYGFAVREAAFVIYAYIYVVIAAGTLVAALLGVFVDPVFALVWMVASIVGLYILHARFRRRTP